MCNHSKRDQSLLTIDQVPRYLRYNYYIRSGYRHIANQHSSGLIHIIESVLSWHNESVNIWTHLLGLVVFIFLVIYELFLHSNYVRWYVLLSCLACIVSYFGSIMYHSTMNKCHCQRDYDVCLNYDVFGIIVTLTLTSISPILNGYKCNNPMLAFTAMLVFLGITYFVSQNVLKTGITPRTRGKYIAFHALSRTTLVLCTVLPNCIYHGRYESLKWHSVSLLILIIGGVINVSRYPEKLFVNKYVSSFFLVQDRARLRKKCDNELSRKEMYHYLLETIRSLIDYIGNSHQIWHIFVMLSTMTCYYGCVWDDIYSRNTICDDLGMYSLASNRFAFSAFNETHDKAAMYAVAMELIFDPSFLYPF